MWSVMLVPRLKRRVWRPRWHFNLPELISRQPDRNNHAPRAARKRLRLPVTVIILSARASEVDRIVGLELGADDYIAKPFSPREVVARVRAVLRRVQGGRESGPRVLRFGRLEIHEAAREARIDGVDIGLKPREYQLLHALADNTGVAMSREALLRKVWGYDFDGDDRTVDVHIRKLRQKLAEGAGLAKCLQTLHGYGYKFSPP